jgi:hypothetical protein
MIIDTGDGRLFLVGEHAEIRLVGRKVKEAWVIETILNPDSVELNHLGREEYLKEFDFGTIIVIVEEEENEEFDGIIVTIMKE